MVNRKNTENVNIHAPYSTKSARKAHGYCVFDFKYHYLNSHLKPIDRRYLIGEDAFFFTPYKELYAQNLPA